MISEQDVLAALAAVPGPDGRTPLPQSGALDGVTVKDGKVFVAIGIDPARAGALEPMRAAAELALRALPSVVDARVSLTAEKKQAPAPPARGGAIPGIARIVAVASGKGGVGKSTTAVNLALALATFGWKIGILDADVYGPSLPRLLGLTGRPQAEGRVLQPLQSFGLKAMSIGFLVEETTAMIWRGPMVMGAITQFLREVAWGELDCLVVDMPPGTGDAQLTLAQTVPLAGAVIVSTPQDLALIDARRGIAMFEKTGVPVLGIVENMSYFLCPHCGERSDVFAHGGARHEAERLGVGFLGEVPLHMTIRETADAGRPIVASRPDTAEAMAYIQIAERVMEALAMRPAKAPPRIVVE